MFLNSWSIALSISSCIVLILILIASRTALRVLLFWNPASDGSRQIGLENEIWLSSTLVEYGLAFQIITLVLFVLAADSFGQVITGAMCATGALLANDYGIPVLLVKMAGVFFYGFWIVLHQLDISVESYPLVRVKYRYLLFLLPFIVSDVVMQTLYIAQLHPDIITSCCAVVFGSGGAGPNLINGGPEEGITVVFYLSMLVIAVFGLLLLVRWRPWLAVVQSALWLWFLALSIKTITTVISSYIYSMPFHKCPFCILKPEYHYIGFLIYSALLAAVFFGITPALVMPFSKKKELQKVVTDYQRLAVKLSLAFLVVFVLSSSYHMVRYLLLGGQV